MNRKGQGALARWWSRVTGGGTGAAAPEAAPAPTPDDGAAPAFEARIRTMQREYAALEAARDQAVAAAGAEQRERLFRRLAGVLADLETMSALARQGREVATADLLTLIGGLQKALAREGMERIGTVGEVLTFDPAAHQRLSGGPAAPGGTVTVRAPGYRCGDTVLLKAMVSGSAGAEGQ